MILSRLERALLDACKKGDTSNVENILSHRIRCFFFLRINIVDSSGWTPLLMALHGEHKRIVDALVKRGAKLNKRYVRRKGKQLIHLAASDGNFDVVKELLKNHVDPNSKEWNEGQTALTLAVIKGHSDIVEILLANGASPNISGDGFTPLFFAAKRGDQKMVEILLRHDADVNTRTTSSTSYSSLKNPLMPSAGASGGWTPLIAATSKGHYKIVKMLVEHGADLNKFDANGCTALAFAYERGFKNIMELLLSKGAKYDDSYMQNTLHWVRERVRVYNSVPDRETLALFRLNRENAKASAETISTHQFNNNNICTRCGCSMKSISEFGWSCSMSDRNKESE
jgi:ankyrin repeat protein